MNQERQRIAIAEFEGFVPNHCGYWNKGGHLYGLEFEAGIDFGLDCHALPDYQNDFRSIQRVVASFPGAKKLIYADHLNDIVNAFSDDYYDGWHASGGSFSEGILDIAEADLEVRMKAILKTIGKWEVVSAL